MSDNKQTKENAGTPNGGGQNNQGNNVQNEYRLAAPPGCCHSRLCYRHPVHRHSAKQGGGGHPSVPALRNLEVDLP